MTLAEAVRWLRRLAYRVIWVTPHRDRPGFEPTVGGLSAVLPSVDRLVAGHSLDALTRLATMLSGGRHSPEGTVR